MTPKRGKKPSGGPPKRTRPPESTGAEEKFLDHVRDEKRELLFHLAGGESLRGTVVEHDRRTLQVRATEGPPRMLFRSEIRLIEEPPV